MSRLGRVVSVAFRLTVQQGLRPRNARCLSGFRLPSDQNRLLRRRASSDDAISMCGQVTNRRFYASLPPHTKVPLPALSPTMENGNIVSWAKKEGDKLNEGDLLAEIETDKATMGFETPEEGYLAKILVPAGAKGVPVGKLVCIIVNNKEDVAKFKDFKDDGAVTAPAAPTPGKPAGAPPPPAPSAPVAAPRPAQSKSEGRTYASPMAKRLAEKRDQRLEGVKGSGIFGSVTAKDLEKAGSGRPAEAKARGGRDKSPPPPRPKPGEKFIDIPLTQMRSIIAKRLLESKTTIPHYYLSIDCRVDELARIRADLNKSLGKSGVKISVNDLLIKAMALASIKVPDVNAAWMGSFIRQYSAVDVSVAVSTPKGLLTPIVFNADTIGVVEISKRVKILAKKAREGKLQPQEFQGGTICISNLGMFSITNFSAVINPPQAAILAVGGLQHRMIPVGGKGPGEPATFIQVTLSCDHRVVDGAVGATWLQAFKEYIEGPHRMLL